MAQDTAGTAHPDPRATNLDPRAQVKSRDPALNADDDSSHIE